jgi:hypothetical protein
MSWEEAIGLALAVSFFTAFIWAAYQAGRKTGD